MVQMRSDENKLTNEVCNTYLNVKGSLAIRRQVGDTNGKEKQGIKFKFKFKCLFFKPHMEEYKKITVNVISKTYNIAHNNVYIIIQSITVFFTIHFLK